MKSILEIITILREFRKTHSSVSNGLCLDITRVQNCQLINGAEKDKFDYWLRSEFRDQTRFFNFSGNACHNPTLFMWPPNDQKSRNKWLDEKISSLTPLTVKKSNHL